MYCVTSLHFIYRRKEKIINIKIKKNFRKRKTILVDRIEKDYCKRTIKKVWESKKKGEIK